MNVLYDLVRALFAGGGGRKNKRRFRQLIAWRSYQEPVPESLPDTSIGVNGAGLQGIRIRRPGTVPSSAREVGTTKVPPNGSTARLDVWSPQSAVSRPHEHSHGARRQDGWTQLPLPFSSSYWGKWGK